MALRGGPRAPRDSRRVGITDEGRQDAGTIPPPPHVCFQRRHLPRHRTTLTSALRSAQRDSPAAESCGSGCSALGVRNPSVAPNLVDVLADMDLDTECELRSEASPSRGYG